MVFCKFSCWITYRSNYFNNLKIELRRQRNKMSNELFTTFSYFSEEEYEKLKQITKTLKEENTKASQSMLIRVAFNELINNKTLKQINDLIKNSK